MLQVKVLKFRVSNVTVTMRKDDKDFEKDWAKQRLKELVTMEEVEEKINSICKELDVVDIKVNTLDIEYNNNGYSNTVDIVYTIIYNKFS